jgi:multidrug efflux pump subunit AcrB
MDIDIFIANKRLLKQYIINLVSLQETISLYGGYSYAPIITQNQYRDTLEEVKRLRDETPNIEDVDIVDIANSIDDVGKSSRSDMEIYLKGQVIQKLERLVHDLKEIIACYKELDNITSNLTKQTRRSANPKEYEKRITELRYYIFMRLKALGIEDIKADVMES